MRHFTIELERGACIEVCAGSGQMDGACLGYAIRFAGTWDAWKVMHPDHRRMQKVGISLATAEEAIAEIVK